MKPGHPSSGALTSPSSNLCPNESVRTTLSSLGSKPMRRVRMAYRPDATESIRNWPSESVLEPRVVPSRITTASQSRAGMPPSASASNICPETVPIEALSRTILAKARDGGSGAQSAGVAGRISSTYRKQPLDKAIASKEVHRRVTERMLVGRSSDRCMHI